MLNIKICLFVGRVVESLLHAISVVGMNSLKYQLQRGFNRSIKLKGLVGFLRPEDFSTRNVPAEAASAAQALRLGQVSLAAMQVRSGGARSRLAGPGMLFVVQPLICGCHGYLVPYESIRVPAGVYVKSDDLSTVVDPIDCGRADALGIIDRRKVSIVKDETVGETRRIYVLPNDLIVIVQAECLRERCPREIESPEFSLGDQKTVVLPGAIDVEAGDRPFVVDAGGLCTTDGRRDGDHREHAALAVKNVRVIDVRGIRVVAGSLLKVIQAEKLVELCAGEIHGRESAVDIQEAVVDSGGIDIEPVGIALVVDSDHLRLCGIGKILQTEIVPRREDETCVA